MIQAIVAGGSAVMGIASGLLQKSQANRMERNNPRPFATVSSPILKNQAMASMMANQGMNQSQYNNALNQQTLGLASGLRSQGLYGRGAFNAGSLFRNYSNSINQLNVADDNARRQNQQTLYDANTALASEEQRVWNWNKAKPFEEQQQRIANLRETANKNISGAISSVAGAGLMGAFGGGNLLGGLMQPKTQ